jgi:hypothetical protein
MSREPAVDEPPLFHTQGVATIKPIALQFKDLLDHLLALLRRQVWKFVQDFSQTHGPTLDRVNTEFNHVHRTPPPNLHFRTVVRSCSHRANLLCFP